MAPSGDPRIEKMYSGDRLWSIVARATLWATYIFVLAKVLPLAGTEAVYMTLAAGAGLVLLFNTAAVWAMVSHYGEDKQAIYGLDLHYLDLSKKTHN